jgi:glutamate racemase
LKWKQQYIDSNPTKYLSSNNKFTPTFNNMRFPIMKQYIEQIIRWTFNWFKSEWIIQQTAKAFDKKPKTTKLRTATKKKSASVSTTKKSYRKAKWQNFLLEEFPLTKID